MASGYLCHFAVQAKPAGEGRKGPAWAPWKKNEENEEMGRLRASGAGPAFGLGAGLPCGGGYDPRLLPERSGPALPDQRQALIIGMTQKNRSYEVFCLNALYNKVEFFLF